MAARFLHHERADLHARTQRTRNELCLRQLGSKQSLSTTAGTSLPSLPRRMRRILIDHARARVAEKRGDVQQRVSLSAVDGWNPVDRSEDVLALDEALTRLEIADPRAALVVELRFFGGLNEEQFAEVLLVSLITVQRD